MQAQDDYIAGVAKTPRRSRLALVALAVCAGLMGCAQSPEVERAPFLPTISPDIKADIGIHPLRLKDAIRFGVLSSNDVTASKTSITQKRNEVTIAKAAFFPEFYFDMSAADTSGLLASGGTGLRYTLFDFGERAALVSAADAKVRKSKYQTIVAIEDAIENTVKAYVNLAIEENQVAAAKAYRAGVDRLEGGVRARVEIGVASSVDLNEIEAERLKAISAVLNAEAERTNAIEALTSLTGVRPVSILPISTLHKALAVDDDPTKLIQPAEFPRIGALIQEHREAQHQNKAVKAGLLPRIAVNMGLGFSLGKDGKLIDNGVKVGPNISEAISLGGGRRERVKNAQLDVDTSRRAIDEEVRLLKLRLVQAHTKYRASADSLVKRRKIVEYAEKSRDVMVSDYEVGNRSLRDILDSQRRIHDALKDLNEARRNALVDCLELLAATNGLSHKLYGAPDET